MGAQEHEDDWVEADAAVEDEEREGESPTPTQSAEERRLIRKLAEYDIGLQATGNSTLEFTANPKWNSSSSKMVVHLPRKNTIDLLAQFDKDIVLSTKWAAIAIPEDGYFEVLVSPTHGSLMPRFLYNRLSRLMQDDIDSPCVIHDTQDYPSLSFYSGKDAPEASRLHLRGDDVCLEVSGPSPACHVLANVGFRAVPRNPISVRVFHNQAMSLRSLESTTEPIINSLLYEMDVRNNLNMRPVPWPSQAERRRPADRRRPERIVRFPEIKVEPEVSVLFRFAGSATGNPPLAFLSYYQVLENYFPIAGRKSALRKLELELADPKFSRRSDKWLIRLLTIGENAAAASESTVLKMLLDEFVREDQLVQFFTEGNWGKYFTKSGPIQGIKENINVENRQIPLAHQVAERIYRIRNRIVHAKDDPKYQEIPVLLPQSAEAEALWPDIDLVRLLACEVILSSQVR